ncbi:hypothetical protein V1477_003295 [Vespula maculifrons]|uniref:Uncharacterized protein n=1 Tax=Vespula maculifrons TaxID=7453 RepID=A0ABD2CU88_VESMC
MKTRARRRVRDRLRVFTFLFPLTSALDDVDDDDDNSEDDEYDDDNDDDSDDKDEGEDEDVYDEFNASFVARGMLTMTQRKENDVYKARRAAMTVTAAIAISVAAILSGTIRAAAPEKISQRRANQLGRGTRLRLLGVAPRERRCRGCSSTCTLHEHIPPNECTRHVRGILCSPPPPPPPPLPLPPLPLLPHSPTPTPLPPPLSPPPPPPPPPPVEPPPEYR